MKKTTFVIGMISLPGVDPRVPYLPLERSAARLSRIYRVAFEDVLNDGTFIGGPFLQEFETAFAESWGSKFCVGVANGLDALTLALRALNVGKGHQVIVPAQTFAATFIAVLRTGATPLVVDVDPCTGLLDHQGVSDSMTNAVKAVVPVHLHGRLVDLSQLRKAIGNPSVHIVCDAAQAHGLNSPLGLSVADAFSFYPTKNLGALGDAGGVCTDDDSLARGIRMVANYGRSEVDHQMVTLGVNSRLDSLQAAFLRKRLDCLAYENSVRASIADRYCSQDLSAQLRVLGLCSGRPTNWHHFVIVAEDRQRFMQHMRDWGVETRIHYPVPAYRMKAFSGRLDFHFTRDDLAAHADVMANNCVSIPCHPDMTEPELEVVENALASYA